MPKLNGLELCRRIRKLEEKTELDTCYIILLTGTIELDKAIESLETGVDDFINKPCDPRELTARIKVGFRIIELQNDLKRANCQLETYVHSND